MTGFSRLMASSGEGGSSPEDCSSGKVLAESTCLEVLKGAYIGHYLFWRGGFVLLGCVIKLVVSLIVAVAILVVPVFNFFLSRSSTELHLIEGWTERRVSNTLTSELTSWLKSRWTHCSSCSWKVEGLQGSTNTFMTSSAAPVL